MKLDKLAEKLSAPIKEACAREERLAKKRKKEEARKRKKILEVKQNLCIRFRRQDNLFGTVCDGLCPLAQIKVSGHGGYECAEIHDRDFSTDFLYDAITTDSWTPPEDWKYPEHREICRKFYERENKEDK